jgi:adenylate cyclase
VLEGSVRKAGERIRITAQLIRADDDAHLWSENYDRELSTENLFAIQDEIARAIVSALRETLDTEIAGTAAVTARTDDLDAYELYLRALNARSIMSTESARARVELLQQAVSIDPAFGDAWAELASDLVGLPTWDHHLDPDPYLQRGIEAAERSLALDPGNLRAYQALRNAWFYLAQWEQADDVLQRARSASVDLKPSSLELMELGYLEQAIQRAEEELKTQPDNNLAQLMIALALEAMGDYEQAMAQFETAILAGYHGGAEYNIAAIQQLQGRNRMRTVSLARDWEERDPELLPLLPHVIRLLAASDAEVGAEADRLVRIAQQMGFELEDLVALGPRWGFRMPYAVVAALGHSDRVVDLLWANEPKFWMWGTDFRRVRQSEAWRERVRDTGLLAYWQQHGWPDKCRPVGEDDFQCD